MHNKCLTLTHFFSFNNFHRYIAVITTETGQSTLYTYGFDDIFCVTFYSLVCIVLHGLIQQYLLDKSARKLHLSKIKHSKFNESGQLLTFYIVSLIWALDLIRRDRVSRLSFAETIGGPQAEMSQGIKLYFIIQIAYWLHSIPEFYLQRIKKEEINHRSVYVSLYLVTFICAYILSITRIALFLIVLHYSAEAVFHLARLLYFRQSNNIYPLAFKAWNITFVAARLASITLSFLVFYLGLGSSINTQVTDYIAQSTILRMVILLGIFSLQTHLMWKYLVFHLGRMRPAVVENKKSRKND